MSHTLNMDTEYMVSSRRAQVCKFFHTYIYTRRSMTCAAGVFLACFLLSVFLRPACPDPPPGAQGLALAGTSATSSISNITPTCPTSCDQTTMEPTTDSTTEESASTSGTRQKEYTLVTEEMNWFQALEFCFRDSKRLAVVDGEEDNQRIVGLLEQSENHVDQVWIGASDLGAEGQFVWTATGQPVTWTHWDRVGAHQPDNWRDREHCVHMIEHSQPDGWHWNDVECSFTMPFVCETNLF